MKLSIYLLKDPTTNKPMFVGVTKSLYNIRRQHPAFWCYQNNPAKIAWIKQLVKAKLRPKIEFITYASPHDLKWKRAAIIKHLTNLGYELFNVTDGDTKRSKAAKSLWQNNEYRNKNLTKRLENLVSYLDYLKNVPSI